MTAAKAEHAQASAAVSQAADAALQRAAAVRTSLQGNEATLGTVVDSDALVSTAPAPAAQSGDALLPHRANGTADAATDRTGAALAAEGSLSRTTTSGTAVEVVATSMSELPSNELQLDSQAALLHAERFALQPAAGLLLPVLPDACRITAPGYGNFAVDSALDAPRHSSEAGPLVPAAPPQPPAAYPSGMAAASELRGRSAPGSHAAGEGDLAAITEVLQTCVARHVLAQYRCTSRACVRCACVAPLTTHRHLIHQYIRECVSTSADCLERSHFRIHMQSSVDVSERVLRCGLSRLFLEDLGLLEHLSTLRQLFFMGAGDWGASLVAGLCAAGSRRGALAVGDLRYVLEDSLKARLCNHSVSLRSNVHHP